jgi:predicted lipid-binding transport protein (Tim44 family)
MTSPDGDFFRETNMNLSQRTRGLFKVIAVALALAIPTVLTVASADARAGGGFSSGSRGSRTFAAPPSTSTAPGTASPFNRTITQPSSPGLNTPAGGGFFNSPGRGLLGGLAAGFLGAGLLGMLFGGGLFGGLGGFASLLGMLLQIALIVFLIRMAMNWWQRRHVAAAAYAGPGQASTMQSGFGSGLGFGMGSNSPPLEIQPADYENFERLLGEIQQAWSDEDVNRLHTLASPEMVSYLARDLEQNRARGVVNKTSNVKLLQGDLAEAWREGNTDYATVAMRFSLVDKTIDRASGRLVEGSEAPTEITEVWTFVRPRGSNWELSGIQQTS